MKVEPDTLSFEEDLNVRLKKIRDKIGSMNPAS